MCTNPLRLFEIDEDTRKIYGKEVHHIEIGFDGKIIPVKSRYVNSNSAKVIHSFIEIPCRTCYEFYCIIRYTLSGIEYTEVFKEDDVKRAKKRNLFRAFGFSSLLTIMTLLFGSPILDSIMVSLIAGALLYCMDTISLRKSYRKNQEL